MTVATATTWRIRGLTLRDPLALVSPADFRVAREGVLNAQDIWNDPRYSLYCLNWDRQEVLLVELPDAEAHANAPFYYQAQRLEAQRVLTLPFEEFHRLVEEANPPSPNLLLTYSVGRSGSTLIARALRQSGHGASFSEPDFYTQLVESDCAAEDKRRWLLNSTRFLCRNLNGKQLAALKFRSFVIELSGDFQHVFPQARTLFLYRDADSFVRSAMQAYRYPGAPLRRFETLSSWPILKELLAVSLRLQRRRVARFIPKICEYSSRRVIQRGPVGLLVLMWLSVMRGYVAFEPFAAHSAALRYDDLVTHHQEAIARVLEFAGLTAELLPRALQAYGVDSQRGSVLAQDQRRNWTPTSYEQGLVKTIVGEDPVIRTTSFVAPRTIEFS